MSSCPTGLEPEVALVCVEITYPGAGHFSYRRLDEPHENAVWVPAELVASWDAVFELYTHMQNQLAEYDNLVMDAQDVRGKEK